MNSIESQINEILRCYKCGNCRACCPVFQEIEDESAVARGLIALIEARKDGIIEYTATFQEYLYRCLNCDICVDNCPSGVRFDKLLLATRFALIEKRNLDFLKRRISKNINHFDKSSFGYKIVQLLLSTLLPQLSDSDATCKILNPITDKISPRKYKSILGDMENSHVPSGKPTKIYLYLDCISQYLFPSIGKKIISFLSNNNVQFNIVNSTNCFFYSLLNLGDRIAAKKINRISKKLLSDQHTIITASPYHRKLLKDYIPEFLSNTKKSTSKIISLRKFAEKELDKKVDNRLVSKNIRQIDCYINDLFYPLINPELSERLINKCIQTMEDSESDKFVSDNPFCVWILNERISKKNVELKIDFITSFL